MRARLTPVIAAALVTTSCFQVAPLPDCEDAAGPGGLYTRHHVCMPLAGEPLKMPVAPRRLLRGDFDDEGVDNDFAVLLDLGYIQVYTTRDEVTELAASLQVNGRIEGITAARYFDGGTHGDDLIGVTAGDRDNGTPGKVFGFHNGGDLFAAAPEVFDAFTVIPPGVCPAPNSIETLDVSGQATAAGLAIGCDSAAPMDGGNQPLDGIVVFADEGPFEAQMRLGLQFGGLAGVHAVNVAQLDGLGIEDIVVAYTPSTRPDEALSVQPLHADVTTEQPASIDVPLAHGAISRVLVGDLDGDADIDLVAVHPEGRGISVIRQRRGEPLSFEAPQFFAVGQVIRDAILGDFTGDGEVDIAVAHEVDDTGLNTIAILVRTPDLAPGQVDYALAPAGSTSGEIVDLEPIDYDGDGRTDIAAVVKSGSEGRVHVWLNRSPRGE